MVIWIIGLSGSGKTTLAEAVIDKVRDRGRKIILLDGDNVRGLFGNDLGFDVEARKRNARRIADLSYFLDSQGVDVICAVLSICEDSRDWCRNKITSYFEVFIDSPLQQLIERDSKGLYGLYERGEICNVVGLDLDFPRPKSADLLIKNDNSLDNLIKHADAIYEIICRSS